MKRYGGCAYRRLTAHRPTYARRIQELDSAMEKADILAEPVAYGILNIGIEN